MAERKKPSKKTKKTKKPARKTKKEEKKKKDILEETIFDEPAAMKDIRPDKLKPKKEQETKRGIPLLPAVAVIVIIALIGALFIFSSQPGNVENNFFINIMNIFNPASGEPVGTGDNITISYSVSSRDGDFEQEGVYDFIVGQGMAIDGVDQGVIGMRLGETKTLVIPPEEGYGESDPLQMTIWPLVQEVDKVVNLTVDMFNVSFGEMPEEGKSYDTVVYPWEAEVTKIEDGLVFMEQMPEDGQVVELPYGNTTVNIKNEKLEIILSPIVGEQFTAVYGPSGFPEISEANETHMILDLNHPLAGKTLDFTITIDEIVPA